MKIFTHKAANFSGYYRIVILEPAGDVTVIDDVYRAKQHADMVECLLDDCHTVKLTRGRMIAKIEIEKL